MANRKSTFSPASSGRSSSNDPIFRHRAEGVGALRPPSAVVFSRLLTTAALLGAFITVALMFGVPAPAHAAGEVLVSNTGKSNNLHTVANREIAQSFNTGGTSINFYLESIELDVMTAPGSGTLEVKVRADGSGSNTPGDLLYTLINPSSVGTGIQEFTAPDDATLDPNTKYWLHLTYYGGGTKPGFRKTNSNGESSGTAPGWSIGNNRINRSNSSGSWVTFPDALKIRVNGIAAPLYVSNNGQTNAPLEAQVGTLSYAQGFTTGGGPVGFYLGSIDLDVTRAPGSGTLNVTVRKANASGNPGDIVYSLTNPASIGTGIHNFRAPEGAYLNRNTDYFVRLVYGGGGTEPKFNFTTYAVEDSGAYSGWSIADQHRFTSSGSWTSYVNPVKISVKGPVIDPPAPAAPTNLAAVASEGQVALTWDDPENISIRKYQYSTNGGTTFNHMNGSNKDTTSFTITGLTNGTVYTLAIRASNLSGEGEAATVTAAPRWPAVTNLVATPGDRRLTFNWDNPGIPGITSYQIMFSSFYQTIPDSDSNTTSYTLSSLSPGTTYTVNLYFFEQGGRSEKATVTARTLWRKPANLVAAPDNGRVVLEWDTDNSAITNYLVRSGVAGGTDDPTETLVTPGSGPKTRVELTGLTNGTEYAFSVRAAEVSGGETTVTGVKSTANQTPAVSLPTAPTGLAATPGNGQVELSWDNPGNITITEYQYSTDGGTNFIQIPGSDRGTTAYTITGLSGDTLYTFAVRAKNFSGEAPASTVSFELYTGTVLVSNTGQSADRETVATIFGFAQKFTTGENAAGYYLSSITLNVSTAPGNGTLTVTVRTESSTGTPSGNALYNLTNPSSVGTGLQTFSAPGNAFLNPDTNYFVQMSYSGGGTIPRWQVTNSNSEDSASHPGWSIADKRYRFNGGYWSDTDDPIQIGVNTTPAPANIVTTPDDQRVVLQWDTGDAAITHYLVRSKTLHGSDNPSYTSVPAGSGNKTRAEVTGLTNGTEYVFAVMAAAVSGSVTKGLGSHVSVTETPAVAVLAAPTNLTATPGDSQAVLAWDNPNNITINKYQQLTVPELKLNADDGANLDRFGISVAMDGDTLVVGASRDDDGGTNSGSAYVYTKNGSGTWSQQTKLNASDASENDRFGISVAVDGDTAVVGAYNEGTSANKPGAAYVFNRNASDVWSQAAKLTASDRATDDQSGYSVALHGDTAMVGAHRDDNANGVKAGAVYVFTKQSGSFTTSTETQKLTASDGAAGDEFGISIALEGNTAVIGAYRDDGNIGSIYIFTKDSLGVWNQVAKLTSSDRQTSDLFGGSVALDGDTLVVGAFIRNEGGWFGSGAVYIFTKPQGGWADSTETAKLTAYDAQPTNWFGLSVEVDDDQLWVGASGSDDQFDSDGRGSIYFFTKPTGGWANIDINSAAKLMASDGTTNDRFGFSIAVDEDTAVTGAWLGDGGASESGAAYILQIPEWADIPGSGYATTAHTVTGLTNGNEYTFAVRAENDSGVSPASTASAEPSE